MSGRGTLGDGTKKMKWEEEGPDDEGALVMRLEEGRCTPFQVDLIRELIFSHLEDKDLLRARLVCKEWTPLATEEYRGRASYSPWIGQREEGLRDWAVGDTELLLDDFSVSKFLDVMTPCPPLLVPIQQLSFRLDLLSVSPKALISLLTFIAPWIKTLRVVPWRHRNVVDLTSALAGDDAMKAMEWVSALHEDFPPLQLEFPCLETLEVGTKSWSDDLHQTLALPMTMVMKKIVQAARNINSFKYWARFFCDDEDTTAAERRATKFLTSALPKTLKRLQFDEFDSEVDYDALSNLNLHLEKFSGKGGMPDSDSRQAFLRFMEEQRMSLERLRMRDLEDVYGPDFPSFPLLTHLRMNGKARSSLECLQAFPSLHTLRLDTEGWQRDVHHTPHLPTHASVRKLIITGYTGIINFVLIANVLPNLSHLDYYCMTPSHLTQLFAHLPRLQSIRLEFATSFFQQDVFESVLSGIPPHLSDLTKGFKLEDAAAFDAISVIASRSDDVDPIIGLANLKDLRVIEMSEVTGHYEFFFSKLVFQTVLMKLSSLREIRLRQAPVQACEPVLEALRAKGVHVYVLKVKKQLKR